MQKIADYVIRPTRRLYDPNTELGPTLFTVHQKYYCSRTDFEVRNRRYKTLKCSLFHHNVEGNTRHPLIVFCHGNSGNRTYSYEIVSRMLQSHISVLTFDFAGCGLSEGKFVFQGFFEQYDIEDVLEYALKTYSFIDPQKIGLWGRSMGAIAALLFASHNNTASFIIIDSPFKDFSDVLNEYIDRVKIIPSIVGKYISSKLRSRILQTSGFDFEELKPIEAIATCRTPALFHHAANDKIVPNYHSKDLFNAYPGEKEYLESEGGHNSQRSDEYYVEVLRFIKKVLSRRRSILEGGIVLQNTSQPIRHRGEEDNVPAMEFEHEVEDEEDFDKTDCRMESDVSRGKESDKSRDKSRDKDNDNSKEIENDKSRDKSRDKENDMSKRKESDEIKEKEGDKSKEHESDKSKDKEIDKSKDRSRDKENDKSNRKGSDESKGRESDKENERGKEDVTPSHDGRESTKKKNLEDKFEREKEFVIQIKHSNNHDEDEEENNDFESSGYDINDEDNFLCLNEKDELFSPGSESSHNAMIMDSPDVSHIMSEPDLHRSKPYKKYHNYNKKSTQHSSFQIYE